jgi:hypothetical protein
MMAVARSTAPAQRGDPHRPYKRRRRGLMVAGVEPGQMRTLQRRVWEWWTKRGPDKEVYSPQEHAPGRTASMDFHARDGDRRHHLGGAVRAHVLRARAGAQRLRFVQLAFGETFEALVRGLQDGLWALGGVPERVRQDNLSAATHELAKTGGRALTRRFADVVGAW